MNGTSKIMSELDQATLKRHNMRLLGPNLELYFWPFLTRGLHGDTQSPCSRVKKKNVVCSLLFRMCCVDTFRESGVLQRFFLHGYTANGGCRVRRRVRKLKNKGRDLTLKISDYVILMSLDTFLTLFSSYHSYFCSCRPSKKVVQMWKS